MKVHHLLILIFFCTSTAWADFSASRFIMHPAQPANDPFVLELTGEWPTDCHPGEQKPVISEYTGDTVLIEFETIVEHVTCNDVATPYRVLVDMSDVIDGTENGHLKIEATVRYAGEEVTQRLDTLCICSPVPRGPDVKPESGLYDAQKLEKQGLLVARQTDRMAVYPLIYDDKGSSEWLFGAGGIVEDVFFSDLYELTGGQCLGCAPPDDNPQMNVVGKITMLMDSEGLTQVKVNDGLFVPYEQSEFGYGSHNIGGDPERSIPDFSGRYAFVDDQYSRPNHTPEGYPILPEVFDVRLSVVESTQPMPGVSTALPGFARYEIVDTAGNETAQMQCTYDVEEEQTPFLEVICDISNAEVNIGEPMFRVKAPSIERLKFTWLGPVVGTGTKVPVYTAVRVDERK